jgi:hypothetical protein
LNNSSSCRNGPWLSIFQSMSSIVALGMWQMDNIGVWVKVEYKTTGNKEVFS